MARTAKSHNASGFTLLELLVAVGIIGILASIAIPQFNAYRQRAFDARCKSDLVSAANAQDAYYIDWGVFKSCSDAANCLSTLPDLRLSDGVMMATTTVSTQYFVMTATHAQARATFTWNSDAGGLQ